MGKSMSKKKNKDYLKIYDLENYLLDIVSTEFKKCGYLEAFDFFCIIIWKAERAKTKTAERLIKIGKTSNLDKICKEITSQIFNMKSDEDKLRYLLKVWDFSIPMASAILTILYPNEFTVYDGNVCEILGKHEKLVNKTNADNIIEGYYNYVKDVKNKVPNIKSLRDKDRYLWAESFCTNLNALIKKYKNLTMLNKS